MEMNNMNEDIISLRGNDRRNSDDSGKRKSIWSSITMEPLWFGAIISLTMGFTTFQNLFLRHACTVDLGYTQDICFNSTGANRTKIEMQSQQYVASLLVGSNFIGGVITCIVLLFLGPWSDASGRRRPVIMLPIVGMMATSLGLLILQAFPHTPAIWAVYIEVLPLSIGGSNPLLMMATFSYLGDVCYRTGRCATSVMGSNSAAISASTILGSLLAPLLLRKLGFVGVFAISIFLELTSFLYAYWKVNDVNISEKVPPILDLKLPIESLKCMFKKREGFRRRNVILMVMVPSTTTITFATEITLLYLYLRFKFQWTEVEYGVFSAVRGVSHFIGTILIIKILKHELKLNDETIGLIGGISQFLGSAMLIISSQSWMIFLCPLMGIFSRAVLIAEKPVLNKQIVANEQGKLNSITAILDKVLAFAVIPLTHHIYSKTISWMPEFFLLLSLVAAVVQIASYCAIKSDEDIIIVDDENKVI